MSIDKLSEEFPRLLKVMYSPSRELDKAITAICKAITKEAEKDIKDKDMDEFIANVNEYHYKLYDKLLAACTNMRNLQ